MEPTELERMANPNKPELFMPTNNMYLISQNEVTVFLKKYNINTINNKIVPNINDIDYSSVIVVRELIRALDEYKINNNLSYDTQEILEDAKSFLKHLLTKIKYNHKPIGNNIGAGKISRRKRIKSRVIRKKTTKRRKK